MSKICIGILYGENITAEILHKQIVSKLSAFSLGCFYEISYNEPLLESFPVKSRSVFSISDNYIFDNCEMFLLPDNCMFNGRENSLPFIERMTQLKEILASILELVPEVNLFLGDSGTLIDDFQQHKICISDFELFTKKLNHPDWGNIHLAVIQD